MFRWSRAQTAFRRHGRACNRPSTSCSGRPRRGCPAAQTSHAVCAELDCDCQALDVGDTRTRNGSNLARCARDRAGFRAHPSPQASGVTSTNAIVRIDHCSRRHFLRNGSVHHLRRPHRHHGADARGQSRARLVRHDRRLCRGLPDPERRRFLSCAAGRRRGAGHSRRRCRDHRLSPALPQGRARSGAADHRHGVRGDRGGDRDFRGVSLPRAVSGLPVATGRYRLSHLSGLSAVPDRGRRRDRASSCGT